jgi:thiol-disulfide isomerase/thioredoxin
VQKHNFEEAFDDFKKADKQDGGHCIACLGNGNVLKYGLKFRDWKAAESAANALVQESQEPKDLAAAHYQLGVVFFRQRLEKHKDELFDRTHEEMTKALQAAPEFRKAILADGQALAYLKQDDAAKARFSEFVKLSPDEDVDRQRALRYINEPELARARMAPPFSIVTMDGQHISFDDLQGKVVLIDFWATWCAPCQASVPHMREIARKFQDQPLVILSVSLDNDEQKWKDFVSQNGMTWMHYRDGGFKGSIATLFAVNAIPHTFTVNADGVLQDEHIGEAAIEGKLKKLS